MQDLDHTIRQCQQGDALAWEALIKHTQGRVYAVAWYFFRNKQEAEDVTQEVFIKVYRRLNTFRSDQDSFMPWLLAIARNCCIDRLRRNKHHVSYEDEIQQAGEEAQVQASDPEREMGSDQRKRLIYQALDKVDPTNREIILLKEIQGMKNEDVAEILSLPVGTIKSRASRARIKLAKILSGLAGYKIKRSGVL